MNEMRSASYRISAPSTVQYQSIISRRRLVCSTMCDSFLGEAMLSSLALTMVSLDRCPRNPGESTAAEFHSQLWPVHEKRGVLAAFGAGACEGDHVMGDDPDM